MNQDQQRLDGIRLCAYRRNRKMEREYSLLSRLELRLRNSLESGEVTCWLPAQRENEMFVIPTKWSTCPLIGLEWKCASDTKYRTPLIWRLEEVRPPMQPKDDHKPQIKYDQRELLNFEPLFDVPHPLIRLYSFCSPIRVSHFRNLSEQDKEAQMEYDIKSAYYLADKLGVSLEMFAEESSGSWRRYYNDCGTLDSRGRNLIYIKNEHDVVSFALTRTEKGNDHLLLPVAFYARPDYPALLKVYELPQGNITFYNADKLSSYPGATVYLTDEMAVATTNEANPERVFCSFYGGEEVLDRLDFRALKGRRVVWLMFSSPTEPQASDKQLIGLALKVASQLSGNDISCSFAWFSECQWEMDAECDVAENHEKRMLSLSELLTMARELRLMIPENLDNDELSLMSAAELRHCQPAPFLIDPIIRESSYAVMYGGTGVAKTWLALTVGLAVANGKDIFPGRWLIPEHSGGKVLYIAGEMTLGDFGPRVDRLLQKETGENFSFKRPLALDLVTPEGQAFVMKLVHECDYNFGDRGKRTRLIILDNLTTLASGGDLPANFNRILNLIERLKGRGIAVLLVHHENASGGIQGATIVTNVADMQLHLVRGTAKGDEISLLISTGKRRSVAASQVQSFKATLRVDVPNTTWKISQPSQDELAMLGEMDGAVNTRKLNKEDRIAWDLLLPRVQRYEVIRLHFLGCSDAEIAQALSTTTATIVEFRRKNELEADQLLQYRRWAFSVKTSFHDMKSARKVAEAINKYWENTSPNYNRAEDVRDEDENEEDETYSDSAE